jgi:glycosyltransferase involved in cell wall biosynthesis
MRVDHISFSKSGGAGIVASLLQESQDQAGLDSRLLTSIDTDLFQEPFKSPLLTLGAALDSYVVSSRVRPTLFSMFRSSSSTGLSGVREDSIIHLHWVEGVVGHEKLRTLLEQGRKVVWTLHDMAPFTGGCHHAFECAGFKDNCRNCPQVRSMFRSKVRLNLEHKILHKKYENLRIVAPTNWLAQRAESSTILRDQEISVITNPISQMFFQNFSREQSRKKLRLDPTSMVGVLVANNLTDPNKRVQNVVEIFKRVSESTSGKSLKLILIGGQGAQFQTSSSTLITWLGTLEPLELAEAASAADFLVSYSDAESAGMTIRECGALGVPVISSVAGGSEEIYSQGISGYSVDSESSLETLLEASVSGSIDLAPLGENARRDALVSHPRNVMEKYQRLYESFE